REFLYADGRRQERELGPVWVRVADRVAPTFAVFAEEDAPILLGAVTMEALGLTPDVVNRQLVPMSFVPLLIRL
ncbi:MAG: hypothetical protein ACE5IZ_10955, partial [Dehalococcoidia bacterium]